jgi:hypothetical protein
MSELQTFRCAACKRDFESTLEDVERACGHLCLAMDMDLTQRRALEQFERARDEA